MPIPPILATQTVLPASSGATQARIRWAKGNLLYEYYIDTGVMKARVHDVQLGVVRTITTNLTGLADARFDMHDSVKGQGVARIGLIISTPFSTVFRESTDGETFT